MKTQKFRLLATIVTLAAVITATNHVSAQRRSTSDDNKGKRTEQARTGNKTNIEKKSANRDDTKELKTSERNIRNSTGVNRHNPSAAKEMKKEVSRSADYVREMRNNRSTEKVTSNNNHFGSNRGAGEHVSNKTKSYDSKKDRSGDYKAVASASEMPRRTTGNSNENRRNPEKEVYNPNRAVSSGNSERYNLDKDDIRYKPDKEYRGSNKYWSSGLRDENRNNHHSNGEYNYDSNKHWDRNWENYSWNHESWINYYGYYNPYSYRYHKYYYHHPYYGHVIRRFDHRPVFYVHNHVKYYCYDGNFFRYRRGIGYILVDIPFGMTFDNLPYDYERVYINGYLYFRVGNLFFEFTNYGYQLVYYPERYYAFNDGYCHEGFRFYDINY